MTQRMLSTEEAILRLKSRPEMATLMRDIYVDDDVVKAAMRFARSEEFRCVAEWAREQHVLPSSRILDLGAGRGIASLAWSIRGYEVVALEPDPSALVGSGAIDEMVQRTGLPITVKRAIGESSGLDPSSIDLVYVRQTLHHAQDLSQMCWEIARVLRPGGALVATREHVVSNREELESFWATHIVHQLAGGEMAYTLQEYRAAFRAAGLKLLRTYGPWDSPVNYFPVTRADMLDASLETLAKRLGPKIGGRMGTTPMYTRIWSVLRSRRDRTPGRMYSFIAVKPASSRPGI